MSEPKAPTGEQCTKNAEVGKNMFACWYPQMGGYVGKCVVLFDEEADSGTCFTAWVWHDGEWPFSDEISPRVLHHCDPNQFILFGARVRARQKSAHPFDVKPIRTFPPYVEQEFLQRTAQLQERLADVTNTAISAIGLARRLYDPEQRKLQTNVEDQLSILESAI